MIRTGLAWPRNRATLGSDQVCPRTGKVSSVFFQRNFGCAGLLTSNAYNSRPPRRMALYRYTFSATPLATFW